MTGAAGELGVFLRARRAQVHPADVGLPSGIGTRRTPGLRREELAALAGVSLQYVTKLEQGKETNPSAAVLDALALALLLDTDAHAHLYELANRSAHRTPPRRPRPEMAHEYAVRPSLEQLLSHLRPCPAYVLNETSDILAINAEALALFAGLDTWPRNRWNTIRHLFLSPDARDLFVDWPEVAATAVANLRSAVDGPVPDASGLVDELSDASQEFARLWGRYDVRPRRSRHKVFHHPAVGELTLHQEVLLISDEPLRLNIYQATPDSPDEMALTLLSLTVGEATSTTAHRDDVRPE